MKPEPVISHLTSIDAKSFRNGKDITNPRHWYELLSGKVGCGNGIQQHHSPNDNTFLPQLAEELDLDCSYGKSPRYDGWTHRRSPISSSAYQHDSPLKRYSTSMVDLSPRNELTFKKKHGNQSSKNVHRVTFCGVGPDVERPVTFPKLSGVETPGIIPETSIIQNENLSHSHQTNLEQWFSQMPDETTTKAKRQVMEQNIQETVQRKGGNKMCVPLPKVSKTFQENIDSFPSCYKELKSENAEDPIIIDRDIYRLQLTSMLKLNNGKTSALDKLDKRKREYVVTSPIHREEPAQIPHVADEDLQSQCESELGFDPQMCPLFVVSTRRAIPLDPNFESKDSHKNSSISCQRKLKRLKHPVSTSKVSWYPGICKSDNNCDKGTTVLSLGNIQYNPTRQPIHILENVRKQREQEQEDVKTVSETSLEIKPTLNSEQIEKNIGQLAKYKTLEVFSENKPVPKDKRTDPKLVKIIRKKEIPISRSPVYKLDRRYLPINVEFPLDNQIHVKTMENIIPVRFENGVVIVGSVDSTNATGRDSYTY